MNLHKDGEVMGVDSDGCLLIWDATLSASYNCGDTREQFGERNLTEAERQMLDNV